MALKIIEQTGRTITTRTANETEIRTMATYDKNAAKECLKLDWPTLTTEQKLEKLKAIVCP